MTTAIVIGATGVTGRGIVRHLLKTDRYDKIKVFARRELDRSDPKLEVHLVDFEQLTEWQHLLQGDDLFSALGTTRRQAGGKRAQYHVDYTLQAALIEAAALNGVQRLFLVSSPGANANSPFFYLRMKAELELFAANQGFKTMAFFKPSIITGDRADARPTETLGAQLAGRLSNILPRSGHLKPISGDQLGCAMVNCACSDLPIGLHIFEPRDIQRLLTAPLT